MEVFWRILKFKPRWLSLYGHFNTEKSTNNILKMAGSGRQFNWTTVILYSMKVTKEHAFHHPFSGLGDQHSLKASQNDSMLESTNSSLFSLKDRMRIVSLQLLISQNHFLYVDPL